MANAGVRITLVFLVDRSEGYFRSKIDQKTRSGNQNQVHGPTDSFLTQRNRRFLFKCGRWVWEDKFKRLLLHFEHFQRRHYGMKLMAYTLINVRRFCAT